MEENKTVVMDETGRVTISKSYRKHLNINPGDKIETSVFSNFVVIAKEGKYKDLLSFEYLYNRIIKLEKDNIFLNNKVEEVLDLVKGHLIGD